MATNLSKTPENNLAPQSGNNNAVEKPSILRLKGGWTMILAGGGLIASAASPAFNWGLRVIDWLDRFEFLGTGFIDLLRWLFSPKGAFALTALFLALFVLAVLYVIKSNLRPHQPAKEVESVPPADVEQPDRIKELEKEKVALEEARDGAIKAHEEARREIERLRHDAVGHSLSLNSRIRELDKYKWLHDLADNQKRNIGNYVWIIYRRVKYEGLRADSPYIEIYFNIINTSVHYISIDKNIRDGAVYLNNDELNPHRKVDGSLENISCNDKDRFLVIKQWLIATEPARISNPSPDAKLFFNRLHLDVKCEGGEPERLHLPESIPLAPPVDSLLESAKAGEQAERIKQLEEALQVSEREREHFRREAEKTRLTAASHDVRASSWEGVYNKLETQYGWLHKMAEAQAKDISNYVVVERVRFCYHKFDTPIPYLIFAVNVRNKSVFDITIEDEMKGHITIAGERLLGEKDLIYNPKILPAGEDSLTIKQRLSPTEVNLVTACEKEPLGAFYYFEKLEIMIAARTEIPHFDRAPLKLPQHISSKDDEIAQLKSELASLHRRSETIVKLNMALGGAYTLEQMFEAGEPPSRERIEHWFNSTLRGHIHPDYLQALCEGMPELTDSPDEQYALIRGYCSKLRRLISGERSKP